ncbi:MAG: hypothetical protein QXQ24_06745 [Nitrososphaeria archaeon]
MNKEKENIVNIFCTIITFFYLLSTFLSLIQFSFFKKVNGFPLIITFSSLIILSLKKILFKQFYIESENFKYFLLSLTLYFFVLFMYLYAFPFFPLIFSQDFIIHLENGKYLISGEYDIKSLPNNPAIAFLFSNFFSLGLNNLLATSRLLITFIHWSAIPFVYNITLKICGKNKTAFIASLTYSLLNPFYHFTLVQTGLYSNALGITVSLIFFYWFIDSIFFNSIKKNILVFLLGILLLVSHSTNIIIFFVSLLSSLYLKFLEKSNISLRPIIFLYITPLVVLIIKPELILRLPSTLESPFTLIEIGGDFVSEALNIIPYLKYIYRISAIGLFLFITCTIISVYYLFRKRIGLFSFFFFWIITIFGISFFSTNAWRFALLSFTPLCMLSILFYDKILAPTYYFVSAKFNSYSFKKLLKYESIILLVIILLLFGPFEPYKIINTSFWSREQQYGFYECLIWFKYNSENDAYVISIGGHPMYFLPIVANRNFLGRFEGKPPEYAYDVLKNYSSGYVVVWNRLHPYNGSFYYVNLYKNSSLFREVWSNSEVTVFKLVKKE